MFIYTPNSYNVFTGVLSLEVHFSLCLSVTNCLIELILPLVRKRQKCSFVCRGRYENYLSEIFSYNLRFQFDHKYLKFSNLFLSLIWASFEDDEKLLRKIKLFREKIFQTSLGFYFTNHDALIVNIFPTNITQHTTFSHAPLLTA